MNFFLTNFLSGITYGMLLFLMAAGLSIIFGLMKIINLAHGSFFIIAGYIAYSLAARGVNFWLALLIVVLAIIVIAFIVEKLLISRVHHSETDQVLLTLGLIFIFGDICMWIWGGNFISFQAPASLSFSIQVGEMFFPAYRLFVILAGLVIAFLLWYFEKKTKIGMIVRAGVDDMEMVSALGFNIKFVFTMVFLFGVALAAVGGVLGGPILGMFPRMEYEILTLSLVVIVIGGLGNWKGAFYAALFVGLADVFGRIYLPSIAPLLVFLIMVITLIFKPSGLFSRGVQS